MPEPINGTRKVFSHKYDVTVHDEAVIIAKELEMSTEDYCSDGVRKENARHRKNPKSVINHASVKYQQVLADNRKLRTDLKNRDEVLKMKDERIQLLEKSIQKSFASRGKQ